MSLTRKIIIRHATARHHHRFRDVMDGTKKITQSLASFCVFYSNCIVCNECVHARGYESTVSSDGIVVKGKPKSDATRLSIVLITDYHSFVLLLFINWKVANNQIYQTRKFMNLNMRQGWAMLRFGGSYCCCDLWFVKFYAIFICYSYIYGFSEPLSRVQAFILLFIIVKSCVRPTNNTLFYDCIRSYFAYISLKKSNID